MCHRDTSFNIWSSIVIAFYLHFIWNAWCENCGRPTWQSRYIPTCFYTWHLWKDKSIPKRWVYIEKFIWMCFSATKPGFAQMSLKASDLTNEGTILDDVQCRCIAMQNGCIWRSFPCTAYEFGQAFCTLTATGLNWAIGFQPSRTC